MGSSAVSFDLSSVFHTVATTIPDHRVLIWRDLELTYAQLGCVLGDKELYDRMLKEVLAADDPDPQQRLNNMLAKRRARRYLNPKRTADCGFMTK